EGLVARQEYPYKFKNGKGWHYFLFPPTSKVQSILLYEQYRSKFNDQYYYGVKPIAPLIVQINYKLKLYSSKMNSFKILMARRLSENKRGKKVREIQKDFEFSVEEGFFRSRVWGGFLGKIDSFSEDEKTLMLLAYIKF